MSVTKQITLFVEFTCIGIILAIIFDFFRAYRKFKIPTNKSTIIQDIIYFVIATMIVVTGITHILDSNFRLYIVVSILIGVMIHVNKFSKYTIKFFILFFETSEFIFEFLNITLAFYKQILTKILKLFKKILKKCCKKFFYVIDFNKYKDKVLHKKTFFKLFKQKKKNSKEVKNYGTKEV
ncbi:MAG: spore cortex biosynthesis protein YabQ [Clostridia bacterium]|nr:spore cortex biosynthesis protein YabQ [Clostridia bacterium]